MKVYKLKSNLIFGDILVNVILWTILIIITVGIAAPFFLFYFAKKIINTTEIQVVENASE